ncbi:hypothetical protein IFM89_021752 [Coptis chinensis]|uniref:Uncharacterized protein n=1 Tax=Coptis chinensis TaxID=261450 RepID=A0A835LF92_9MAGN|nr:hypothetical protein IFM89_021752 [Coptis chinensis]
METTLINKGSVHEDFNYSTGSSLWSPLLPIPLSNKMFHDSSMRRGTKRTESEESPISQRINKKFPLLYDFDYSQSSLWSPLLPVPLTNHTRLCNSPATMGCGTKFSFDAKIEYPRKKMKKVVVQIKKKFSTVVSDAQKKNKVCDFYASCNSPVKKSSPKKKVQGWAKALKVASQPFKKKKDPCFRSLGLEDFLNV